MVVGMKRNLQTVLSTACAIALGVSALSGVAAAASLSTNSSAADAYRLGASDKLRVIVFGEDSLSGEFTVSTSGNLSLPLIGEIPAAGRTLADVREEVQKRLNDGYLKNPRVSIEVLNYRSFYILGEVSKPGEYPYEAGLTVEKAAAIAQGFTYRANRSKIVIRHNNDASEERIRSNDPRLILPGDTIRVDERLF
jgi:polysaccharide export outer membrane protein